MNRKTDSNKIAGQKWIWIELIGFDNTQPDFGVKEYLSNCGFIPDGVSLLLTWMGFVMTHDSLAVERPLSPCECSYYAHPANAQRQRQQWTNFQLRDLIRTLQSYGIRVYLSFFNLASYRDGSGKKVVSEYFQGREYLNETDRFGNRSATVHMLKRLTDGSRFEDEFIAKVIHTLHDYGFDGIHIADGISSGRLSLQEGDYSDDMVGQFLETAPLADIVRHAEGNPEAMRKRAANIWQNHRLAWIHFHANRWLEFFKKFADALNSAGKEAVFNNAWTRDPFESLYRYGIDYRAIGNLGFYGCMPEDVSAGLAILSQEDNGYLMDAQQREQILYDFLANLMQLRAAMPNILILPLAGIHDMMEQWGVLEHMPASMTRNVLCNVNTLFWNGKEHIPIEDGPWFCLGDSLSKAQWEFILNNWKIADWHKTCTPAGPAWVWSDALLDAELSAFVDHRQTPGCFLLPRLLQAGAPLHAIVRTDMLQTYQGDIVVPNAGLLPDAEKTMLLNYDRGNVYLIGFLGDLPVTELVRENNTFGNMVFAQLGKSRSSSKILENNEHYAFDSKTDLEPKGALWTHPLRYPPVSKEFFKEVSQTLTQAANAPALVKYEDRCELISLRLSEKVWQVYIGNDDYYYNIPVVDMKQPIRSACRLTGYEGYPVHFEGSCLRCRIPGRGMEAFLVTLE